MKRGAGKEVREGGETKKLVSNKNIKRISWRIAQKEPGTVFERGMKDTGWNKRSSAIIE